MGRTESEACSDAIEVCSGGQLVLYKVQNAAEVCRCCRDM